MKAIVSKNLMLEVRFGRTNIAMRRLTHRYSVVRRSGGESFRKDQELNLGLCSISLWRHGEWKGGKYVLCYA